MPVETRPSDTFTRDNLLLGFSTVFFTPTGGSEVQLGILGGQELQKEIELLQLQRGDSGPLTVDREIVGSLEVSMQLEVFNFKSDVAQYIFASQDVTAVSADAAAAITNEAVTVPSGTDAESTWANVVNGDVDDTSWTVTCSTITDEAVGTGTGALGATSGEFSLDYKPLIVGDVTSVTVAGVAFTPIAVGAAASGNEVEVVVGTGATSGDLQFFVGGVATDVTNGEAILATYTPSHTLTQNTDYVTSPLDGRLRFLDLDSASSKNGTAELRQGQSVDVDYTYDRKAHVPLKPFTRNQVDGSVVIKHLTDIGVNFIWTIPSATIIITDDALTFGAEEFGTATLSLNINDAGGTDRFGTLELSSETEAGA